MMLNSNVIRRHRVSGGADHQSGCSATRTATSPARPGPVHRVSGAEPKTQVLQSNQKDNRVSDWRPA